MSFNYNRKSLNNSKMNFLKPNSKCYNQIMIYQKFKINNKMKLSK